MVSASGNARGSGSKSRFLRFGFAAFLFIPLAFSCTANKNALENARLFTSDELQTKGVLLAPVAAEEAATTDLGSGDFQVFDRVFESVMQQQWEKRKITIHNSRKSLQTLKPDDVEAWRKALSQGAQVPDEEVMDRVERNYGSGHYLLISGRMLTNQVSCGKRDPLPSYNVRNPGSPVAYCQRLIKMQFQIYDRERKEKVWNGLIYASDESSEKIVKGKEQKENPRPPSAEVLIREAFKNFANMMAGSLETKP